jgi:hypothetical protein
MEARAALTSQAPKFRPPVEQCPYRPDIAAASHPNPFATPAMNSIFALVMDHSEVIAQMESRWRIARDRTRQKRGPPSRFLS